MLLKMILQESQQNQQIRQIPHLLLHRRPVGRRPAVACAARYGLDSLRHVTAGSVALVEAVAHLALTRCGEEPQRELVEALDDLRRNAMPNDVRHAHRAHRSIPLRSDARALLLVAAQEIR